MIPKKGQEWRKLTRGDVFPDEETQRGLGGKAELEMRELV